MTNFQAVCMLGPTRRQSDQLRCSLRVKSCRQILRLFTIRREYCVFLIIYTSHNSIRNICWRVESGKAYFKQWSLGTLYLT